MAYCADFAGRKDASYRNTCVLSDYISSLTVLFCIFSCSLLSLQWPSQTVPVQYGTDATFHSAIIQKHTTYFLNYSMLMRQPHGYPLLLPVLASTGTNLAASVPVLRLTYRVGTYTDVHDTIAAEGRNDDDDFVNCFTSIEASRKNACNRKKKSVSSRIN